MSSFLAPIALKTAASLLLSAMTLEITPKRVKAAKPPMYKMEILKYKLKKIVLTLQDYNFGLGFLNNIFIYTGLFKKEKISFVNFLQDHDLEFLANQLTETLEFLTS